MKVTLLRKMELYKKHIAFIFLFLVFTTTDAQNLVGKWAMILGESKIAIPGCLVIEIKDQKLITRSFDSIISTYELEIDTQNKLFKYGNEKPFKEYKYSIRDSLILTRYFKQQETTNNNVFAYDYIKLLPTEINFPIEKAAKKQYALWKSAFFKTQKTSLIFNRVNEFKRYYRLEKLDDTYLIVCYWDKNRTWMVPIKEINKDHLLVYGIAGKDGFVKVHEIKEIKKPKTFIPD